jgi:hypothetical protein
MLEILNQIKGMMWYTPRMISDSKLGIQFWNLKHFSKINKKKIRVTFFYIYNWLKIKPICSDNRQHHVSIDIVSIKVDLQTRIYDMIYMAIIPPLFVYMMHVFKCFSDHIYIYIISIYVCSVGWRSYVIPLPFN